MYKVIVWLIAGLLIGCLGVQAGPLSLGVGAYGGLNMPVVQDDQASGATYGLAARLRVLPFLTGEANVTFSKWGQPDPISGVEMPDGSDFNSVGLDVLFGGAGGVGSIRPYFVAGIASYKIENEQTGYDFTGVGYSGGLGIGIGIIPKLDIDVRGKVHVAPQEQGSKKAVTLTAGLIYNLASF